MKLRAKKPFKLNHIYNEKCEDTMKRMRDHTVSMVLTSPPYNTSKATYSETSFNNYESRYDVYVDTGTQEEYIEKSISWFKEYDRILCENGVVLYNINYGTGYENTCDNLIRLLFNLLEHTNFMIADIVCWKKNSAIPNNTSSNKCTRIWEFVFVLCRKSENKTFISNKGVKSVSKTGQKFYENIFNFIEAPNNDGICKFNKATFSSKLVLSLLEMYAGQNCEVVYDPFIGTGTTALGVKLFNEKYNRDIKYVGSELSHNQVEFANDRLSN